MTNDEGMLVALSDGDKVDVSTPVVKVTEKIQSNGKFIYKVEVKFLGGVILQQFSREVEKTYSGFAYSRKQEIIFVLERRLNQLKKKKEMQFEKIYVMKKEGD